MWIVFILVFGYKWVYFGRMFWDEIIFVFEGWRNGGEVICINVLDVLFIWVLLGVVMISFVRKDNIKDRLVRKEGKG